MASNGVSTAGAKLGWVAGTSTTAPTSGYTQIPEVKEVPELNPEPSTLETTTLAETEFKTYTTGLKDLGGALSFTCNLTNDLKTEWAKAVTASKSATDNAIWFVIAHPTVGAVAFKGQPSALGMPSMSVDGVLEVSIYIVPTSAPEWLSKDPTFGTNA